MHTSSPVANLTGTRVRQRNARGFILQCLLYFEMQPTLFPTERASIAYTISLLSGKARSWARNIWEAGGPLTESLSGFFRHFKKVLSDQLLPMKQSKATVADCAIQFRTLAANSGWNEPALI